MKAPRIGRALAALITTICVLAATAGPAAATVHTGQVTHGTMTINFPYPNGFMVSDLATPDRPCIATPSRGNPPTLSLDFASFTTSGTTTATAMDLASQYYDANLFGYPSWYELELRLLTPPPSGMYNNGGIISSDMAQNLTLQVVWYRYPFGMHLDPAAPCPPKTAACVGLSQLNLVGTWNTSTKVASLDDVAQLAVIPGYCPDGVVSSTFNGSTITISGMVIDF